MEQVKFMGMARQVNTGADVIALLDHDNTLRFIDVVENAQLFDTAELAYNATLDVVNTLYFRKDIIVSVIKVTV